MSFNGFHLIAKQTTFKHRPPEHVHPHQNNSSIQTVHCALVLFDQLKDTFCYKTPKSVMTFNDCNWTYTFVA